MNRKILISIFFIFLLTFSTFAAEEEYLRKAALFQRISDYIEWPEETGMNDKSKPFVIGVIGKNPFGTILDISYTQKKNKIKGKKVEVKYISKPGEISNFHILFISESMEKNLAEIIAVTRSKPVLTFADTKGFAKQGVLFNFYNLENKIYFEVNVSALQESPITVDPLLLSLARDVRPAEVKK